MTQDTDSKGGWTPGVVARLPWNNGDGYRWGGDVIVCFGERAINLGGDQDSEPLARLIAAAPALVEALKDALAGWRYIRDHHGDLYGVGWDRVEDAAQAALQAAGVNP